VPTARFRPWPTLDGATRSLNYKSSDQIRKAGMWRKRAIKTRSDCRGSGCAAVLGQRVLPQPASPISPAPPGCRRATCSTISGPRRNWRIAVADVFVGETQSLILEAETASPDPRERIRFLLRQSWPVKPQPGRQWMSDQLPRCGISDGQRLRPLPAPGQSFELLVGFVARELQKTGPRPSIAMARARGW
jgi:hypothetical protein